MADAVNINNVLCSDWLGCYDSGWQGEIVPESFAHPAKMSRALVRRIYEHAFEQGWLLPGSGQIVCDPFAGIAGSCLDALWHGLNWVGVELEPKFVKLGSQNIALWQRKYGSKAGFGTARIVQGDSRRLAEVIGEVDCCIGSPPFSQAQSGGGINREKVVKQKDGRIHALGNDGYNADMQGNSPGQLGSLREGKFDTVISSPPYEGSLRSVGDMHRRDVVKQKSRGQSWGRNRDGSASNDNYGGEPGQLGAESGPTFWSAAREILLQCHAVLKPGGHAIFVVKDFVRKGRRVPFSDQWQTLGESVGFRLVCRHRAMLVANHGAQGTIFGETEQLKTERKSFFRRLHEKKYPGTEIDWEDVICLQK